MQGQLLFIYGLTVYLNEWTMIKRRQPGRIAAKMGQDFPLFLGHHAIRKGFILFTRFAVMFTESDISLMLLLHLQEKSESKIALHNNLLTQKGVCVILIVNLSSHI